MGRPLRVIQNIYPYHLVCRTNNRTFRFNQRPITRIVFQALKETIEKYNLLVHHVVLMSNHYHIIATATEENIHRAMQYFNSRVAVRYNKHVRRSGHLWGDRYRSCIVDTDDYYLASVRYIYRNPERAGMVDKIEEFPDSSFQYWAFGKKIDVMLVEDHLVMRWGGKSKKRLGINLRILVLSEEGLFTDEQVKKGLRKMFFGSADFIKRMHDTHCCTA
jgi:putative transposase